MALLTVYQLEEVEVIKQQSTSDRSDRSIPDGLDLTSRSISCFNASAKLCTYLPHLYDRPLLNNPAAGILGKIMQVIYAIRPDASRTIELAHLEELLEKWYLDLPEGLRFDPMTKSAIPPPHVLTLHMQYWCTALLLHRPLYVILLELFLIVF